MSFAVSGSGLRRAGVGGLAALVCAGLVTTGSPASALPASGGTIDIVDAQPVATPNLLEGATLVTPGQTGQALANVLVHIPNDFKAGDTIRLALFDRSTSGVITGMNTDAAHKLVFNGTPTVTVAAGTGTAAPPTGAVAPTVTVATAASESLKSSANRSHGTANHDEVVLTIGNTTAGAKTGGYDLTVSGLKVDAGAELTPGEIRVVPFSAASGLLGIVTPTTTFGNKDGAKPTIKFYTVPGYVAPVSLTGAATAIKADGTAHAPGDLTIKEFNDAGLQPGTYTVTVSGATVANDATHSVTVTAAAGNGDVVNAANATVAGNALSFKLDKDAVIDPNAHQASIKLSGLLLSSPTNGPITYTLTGGSIDGFLATAGSSPAIGPYTADSTFGPTALPVSKTGTSIPAPKLTSAGSASGAAPGRLGGADRYATAAQVALRTAADKKNGSIVVLADGEAFPDALSAGYLSQRLGGAPILLTQPNNLPVATSAALAQLHTTSVWIVGGPNAVSNAVATGVRSIVDNNAGGQGKGALGRLAGADRYATNQAVNVASWNNGPVGSTTLTFGQAAAKKTAFLATGQDFADALASGPATAGTDAAIPLILTTGNALSPTAQAQLTTFGITQVVIVGGEQAVSPAVATALTGAGIAVTRIAGVDRYETATKMADFERAARTPASAAVTGGLGFTGKELFLSTGQNYADALAGGPLAANERSSIVLTTSLALSPATGSWIAANKAGLTSVTALGLQSAVSDATLQAAANALG